MRRFLLTLVLLLAFALPAHGASVEFDAASTTTNIGTEITFAHTITTSGTNRFLLVHTAARSSGGAQNVTGVTYGGQAMTLKCAAASPAEAVGTLWLLVDPPTGSNDVVVSLNASRRLVVGAASFLNVDQIAPLSDCVTSVSSGTTSRTVNVASDSGDMVFAGGAKHDSTEAVSIGGSETARWNNVGTHGTADNNPIGTGSTRPGGGTLAMSITWSTTNRSASLIGVAIEQTAALTPRPRHQVIFFD